MKVKYWILLLVATNTGMLAFAIWYARHKFKRLARGGSIVTMPVEMWQELQASIEGVRRHIASNHDERDAEMRTLNERSLRILTIISKFMGGKAQ